jgi:carbon monoxide dehydrogenase subunit G
MLLKLSHAFQAPASPANVFAYLGDVERAAACVPGVEIVGQRANGTFDARITLEAGLIKIPFHGTLDVVRAESDHVISIVARGADASRQTRASAQVHLHIKPARAAIAKVADVDVSGHVEFHGALAGVAKVGGVAIAHNLLRQFGARVAQALEAAE